MNTEVQGTPVEIIQTGNYPWDGSISFRLKVERPFQFQLNLRIPDWARSREIHVNGSPAVPAVVKGYARIDRVWNNGDRVDLLLPMAVERLKAHPSVVQNRGKVAIQRGPIVYCLEQIDHEVDLDQITLPPSFQLESHFEPRLLGGVAVVTGSGRARSAWAGQLYRQVPAAGSRMVPIRAVPYYSWANRRQGKMAVWIESSP